MLRLFLCVIIAMSIVPKPSKAKEASYFDMQLPVMTGAENISHSRDDQYYSTSLSYDIVIDSTDPVYDFYDAFFKKQGWKGFMEGHPMSRKWNGYSAILALKAALSLRILQGGNQLTFRCLVLLTS